MRVGWRQVAAFQAMWPGMWAGNFALFGGTSRPSMHAYAIIIGSDGAVRGHLQRPDHTSWSIPSGMRDVQVADIDGDGAMEVVTALDTNCRQLVAYAVDGTIRWDLDVGGAPGALACDVTARRVLCASDTGYITAVAGTTGRREWLAWIGEPAVCLAVLPEGRLLAVTARGQGWILSAQGEVQGRCELGGELTGVPRPGDHRGRGHRFILGTADGRVFTLR